MPKVFRVTPKRIKRANGLVLTPDMTVIVTTQQYTNSPFNNGAKELKEVYMRIYGFDYQKACCQQADFTFEVLGYSEGLAAVVNPFLYNTRDTLATKIGPASDRNP